MQPLDHVPAFGADLIGKRHQPGQCSVDRDINAGMTLAVERGAVGFRNADMDVALAHETFIADMQIIAVDLAFDAEADAVFRFLAIRNIGAELVAP